MMENLFDTEKNPFPITPPCLCVFYSNEFNTCDFGFLRNFLSSRRIQTNCPRGFNKKGKSSLRFFEWAIMGEFETYRRLDIKTIYDRYPMLKPTQILRILKKKKREGKIVRLQNSSIWRIGNFKGRISLHGSA